MSQPLLPPPLCLTPAQQKLVDHWNASHDPEPFGMQRRSGVKTALAFWVLTRLLEKPHQRITCMPDVFRALSHHLLRLTPRHDVLLFRLGTEFTLLQHSTFIPDVGVEGSSSTLAYISSSSHPYDDDTVFTIVKFPEMRAWRAAVLPLLDAHLIPDLARIVQSYL